MIIRTEGTINGEKFRSGKFDGYAKVGPQYRDDAHHMAIHRELHWWIFKQDENPYKNAVPGTIDSGKQPEGKSSVRGIERDGGIIRYYEG